MKGTSIYPGCKLEDVHDVLIALSILADSEIGCNCKDY